MIDAAAIDITPISGPSYFQEYRDKGRTPLSDRGVHHSFQPTSITGSKEFLIVHGGVQTPTVTELRQGAVQSGQVDIAEVEVNDAVSAVRDARTMLLAKKYVGKSSREDNARLNILTERIRHLSPRVSEAEVDVLASIVDVTEGISANLDVLRQRYGIR